MEACRQRRILTAGCVHADKLFACRRKGRDFPVGLPLVVAALEQALKPSRLTTRCRHLRWYLARSRLPFSNQSLHAWEYLTTIGCAYGHPRTSRGRVGAQGFCSNASSPNRPMSPAGWSYGDLVRRTPGRRICLGDLTIDWSKHLLKINMTTGDQKPRQWLLAAMSYKLRGG